MHNIFHLQPDPSFVAPSRDDGRRQTDAPIAGRPAQKFDFRGETWSIVALNEPRHPSRERDSH